MVAYVNTENWHVQVRKSIGLNREFNLIWLNLELGVRYRNNDFIKYQRK